MEVYYCYQTCVLSVERMIQYFEDSDISEQQLSTDIIACRFLKWSFPLSTKFQLWVAHIFCKLSSHNKNKMKWTAQSSKVALTLPRDQVSLKAGFSSDQSWLGELSGA